MEKLTTEIARLRKTERDGDFFHATELAYRLLNKHYRGPDGKVPPGKRDKPYYEIAYLLTRAVLNCRAVERARRLFHTHYQLNEHTDNFKMRSLGARLEKEDALLSSGEDRRQRLVQAANAYERVHDDFTQERGYSAINVATLSFLHGDTAAARQWARKALAECDRTEPDSREAGYYTAVTRAEAALILDEPMLLEAELKKASDVELRQSATQVTTYRQLKLICDYRNLDVNETLSAIRIPDILFYVGHIVSPPGKPGRFPADNEAAVNEEIRQWLEGQSVSAAYGSLAAGSDILFAEACLDSKINLHAVLPFSQDDFIKASVAPSGGNWVERFHGCLAKCTSKTVEGSSVDYATKDAFLNDEVLFDYGSRYAMGVAMLRAGHLMTNARLVAVFDGRGGSEYGTGKVVDFWKNRGLKVDIIGLPSTAEPKRSYPVPREETGLPKRLPKAVLFGDVVGFSETKEQDIPRFHSDFLKPLFDELLRYEGRIRCHNSWGDAIYVVFDEAIDAARYGLEIQRIIKKLTFVPDGKDKPLSMRIAIHHGPVFDSIDGFHRSPSCFGVHVTQAARIEPITPPGAVFVTEAMAAELELSDETDVACEFVGPISSAKGYGDMLLYVLEPRYEG